MCKTADSLADYADSRRQKTGWTNGSAKADAADYAEKDRYHMVEILLFMLFLCEIMQPAAFICVICAICERIIRKRTQSITKEETPISLADLADHADKRQVGQMDLLKQMPQITLRKTDIT